MKATQDQIERAKSAYMAFLKFRTIESFEPEYIGINTAEQRCEYHNKIVWGILNGDRALERGWKYFFLNNIIKEDAKIEEAKAKLKANKDASVEILAPIRSRKMLGAFGKWLNTNGNPYRREHFNKKYTAESVEAFLQTL